MPQTLTENSLIDTPYGRKRWKLIKHMLDTHSTLVDLLTECVNNNTLPEDIQKRASLMVEECKKF